MIKIIAKQKSQGGLTLIEVVIASVILAAVSAMAAYILWSSSNHVASSEVGVQLELQARELATSIGAELHQTKMATVSPVTYTLPVPTPATVFTVDPTPGTVPTTSPRYTPWDIRLYTPIAPHTALPVVYSYDTTEDANPATSKPHGIRFKIPGSLMDITKTNANADGNNSTIDNFNLAKFKTTSTTSDWLTEIQYWWEADTLSTGLVRKFETTWDSNGTLKKRKLSLVARNVKDLTFIVSKYPAWATSSVSTASAYSTPFEKYISIVVTMQCQDPKYPKDTTKVIWKSVTSTIELRN